MCIAAWCATGILTNKQCKMSSYTANPLENVGLLWPKPPPMWMAHPIFIATPQA